MLICRDNDLEKEENSVLSSCVCVMVMVVICTWRSYVTQYLCMCVRYMCVHDWAFIFLTK